MPRALSALLVAALALGGASALGEEPAAARGQGRPDPGERAAGVIVVGGDRDYPPYEFLDQDGQPAGYNVDLTRAIAEVMGLRVEFRLGGWSEARRALAEGRVDALQGMSWSEERARTLDLSPPHTLVNHAIFARLGTPAVASLEALRGHQVAVHRAGIMDETLTGMGQGATLLRTDTPADALRLLASGQGEYAVVAALPGTYLIRQAKLTNVVQVASNVASHRYGYAVRKGDALLLSRLSEGLAILKQTGRYDVSLRTKIRPERAMAVSSVASQMGITASPVAAAVTTFLGYSAKMGTPVTIFDILKITIPAGLVGVAAAALWSLNRGVDLYKDPEFLKRLEDPKFKEQLDVSVTTLGKELPKTAKLSVALFFGGVLFIVLLALRDTAANAGYALPQIVPVFEGKPVPMTTIVQMVMLGFGAFILFATKVKAYDIAKSSVFSAGMIAVVSIYGIAWMSDTFVSAFAKSQAATLTVMIPFGIALKLPATLMLGLLPASYAYFFFAFYPSDLAAINMDRTGTTHIGKYLLNHSFMIPGLIGVSVSTVVAYLLSQVAF
jgi:anaerobic C4-dicarboxylate transporter DcuB